jgi:hypothetical protein
MVDCIEVQLMSDGERVQQLICDWLEQNYPDGPTWYGRPATEAPTLEIKMISAFGEIEYNLRTAAGHNYCGTASVAGAILLT